MPPCPRCCAASWPAHNSGPGMLAAQRKLVAEMLTAASRQTNRYYFERTIGLRAVLDESIAAGQWSDAWDILGRSGSTRPGTASRVTSRSRTSDR